MTTATETDKDTASKLDKIESILLSIVERMPKPSYTVQQKPEPEKTDPRIERLKQAVELSSKYNRRYKEQLKRCGAGSKTVAIACVLQAYPKFTDSVIDLLVEGTKPIVEALNAVSEESNGEAAKTKT